MKNKKKVQPWLVFLAGVTVLVNIATGLAAPGTTESLLRSTLLPAGILTISPRLESEPAIISDPNEGSLPLIQQRETHPTRPDSIR